MQAKNPNRYNKPNTPFSAAQQPKKGFVNRHVSFETILIF